MMAGIIECQPADIESGTERARGVLDRFICWKWNGPIILLSALLCYGMEDGKNGILCLYVQIAGLRLFETVLLHSALF